MRPLDRRQFLKRSLLLLGGLTGAGAIVDLAVRGATTVPPPPLGAIAMPSPTPSAPTATPGLPGPTDAPLATATPPPAGAPEAVAVRWPEPTPGLQPPNGFDLRVPVLMYHRVVDPAAAGDSLPGLVVPPMLFAAQLAQLHALGWRTITLAQLAHALQHGQRPTPRTFVVTIDDGWLDGATEALPILQGLGYHATYFVIGGRIGRPGFLGPADLRTLVAAGMEIGDHTFDHLSLPQLTPARQQYEIVAASARIAQVVGQAPVTFSYPVGRYSPAAEEALAQQGFALAVTTAPGTGASWPNRFVVPRHRVSPDTSPRILLAQLELAGLGL